MLRVSAVQAAPVLFDPEQSLNLFAAWLKKAADDKSDLVVFPEAFLGGYPKGVDFGARVGSRNAEGRALFQLYFETAFTRDGDAFNQVRALVKEANINVVVGLIERDGSTLYCSVATLNRRGEIAGWRRKLMPTAMERLIWGLGDGSTVDVAYLDETVVSSAICWENYMPLLRQHFYNQRSEVHCVPTVDDRTVWLPSMQMIALEGRCFVVSACQFMQRKDVKDGITFDAIQGNAPDTVLINGGSCIVSPLGEVLAAPIFGKTGLISVNIDKGEIARGKFDLDTAGHYARNDVFSLDVNDGSDASQ